MPDFYAHQTFGRLVWEALTPETRAVLTPQRAGFQLGLYGPDPLFFYRLRPSNPVVREGHAAHDRPPRRVLDRYRDSGARENPYALGYAAGFLCHYLLDAACHPYILSAAQGRPFRHTILEGALDRLLTPSGETGLPTRLPDDPALYNAAALGYDCPDGAQFRVAFRRFRCFSLLVAGFRRITPARRASRPLCRELKSVLEGEVANAARLVEAFISALETGAEPDFLPETDFSGRETRVAISPDL